MPSPLTTHALDTSSGSPAAGLRLELSRLESSDTATSLTTAQCNTDGRVSDLLKDVQAWTAGDYRLRFFTREYFSEKGVQTFYPYCDVVFTIADPAAHYHVPLLISPFGYTTYRGS